MTARFKDHPRYRAERLLIEARSQMIRDCCQSSPLDLRPDFYGHGGKDYAAISHGGTKLEINIGSGAWSSTIPSSSYCGDVGVSVGVISREMPGPTGVITGEKENFLLVLEKVFPG